MASIHIVARFALGIAVSVASHAAAQPSFPDRSIRIVVPFAPGGTADIVARLVSEQVAADQGWRVYVENIAGAGGSAGALAAARGPADGYTLLVCNVSCAVNQFMSGGTGLNPDVDIAPIIVLGYVPNVLVTGPGVSAATLPEFVAVARANPGKITMASAGPGSSSHLSAMLLRVKAQIDIVDITYRGSSAAMPDILSGRVDAMAMGLPESLPFVRDGTLKALGVTSDRRVAALPTIPTIAESGVPGYSILGWLSLVAPRRTPTAVLERLNGAFARTLQSSTLLERFAGQSIEPGGGTAELAGQLLKSDSLLWRQVLEVKPKG